MDPAEVIDATLMGRKLRLFRSGNEFIPGTLGVYPTFNRSLAGISSSDEVRPASMRPHVLQNYQRFERPVYHSVSGDAKSYLYGFAPLIVEHVFLLILPIAQTPSMGDRSGGCPSVGEEGSRRRNSL